MSRQPEKVTYERWYYVWTHQKHFSFPTLNEALAKTRECVEKGHQVTLGRSDREST